MSSKISDWCVAHSPARTAVQWFRVGTFHNWKPFLHNPSLVILLLANSVFVANTAEAAVNLRSMKLLTSRVGWVASTDQLFWTTDGGKQWKDITPRASFPRVRSIASVFFLDTSRGWVLFPEYGKSNDAVEFDIAVTRNAGAYWSFIHVIPSVDQRQFILAGDGQIDFVNAFDGWLNLGVVSSASAHLGILLFTHDGGKTWASAEGGAGSGRGSIRFTTQHDGWTVTPEGDESFYTHDGARSWHELSIPQPTALGVPVQATYGLPFFDDAGRIFVAVSYSGTNDPGYHVVLYSSSNGGKTWQSDVQFFQTTSSWASTVIDAHWIMVAIVDQQIVVTSTALTGKNGSQAGTASATYYLGTATDISSVWHVSFVDARHGWLLANGARCRNGCTVLLSTTDAGAHWNHVAPMKNMGVEQGQEIASFESVKAKGLHPSAMIASPGSLPSPTSNNPLADRHLGFDKSRVIPIADMQLWWDDSPYFDTSVYLPHSPNRGTDSNLNSAWINAIENQGWGLIPIWFGLQSSCACWKGHFENGKFVCTEYYPHQISTDVNTAQQQGIDEADNAVAQANALGLFPEIIYHDIEGYTPSKGCSPPVIAFLGGWVSELYKDNLLWAGVYGNPASAEDDFSQVTPLPDDVWITQPNNHSPRETIWGLTPLCDPFNQSSCPWPDSQRIHQYTLDVEESYGNAGPYQIDGNILDAHIYNGSDIKTYTLTYSNMDYPNAKQTESFGVNDAGDIVGTYYFTSNEAHGFLYTQSTEEYTSIDYPGAAQTQAFGINNSGQIVGWYIDKQSNFHGFLYTKGTYHEISLGENTYTLAYEINDAGHIVGLFKDASGLNGFLYFTSTRVVRTINDGGESAAYGINGDALVSGLKFGGESFLYDPVENTYTDINISNFVAKGINNNLQIVGNTTSGGLIYDFQTDRQTSVVYPGAVLTDAVGINGETVVVGSWTDSNGATHGFAATPE